MAHNEHINDDLSASEHANAYWRANIRLLIKLLLVWFTVSFLAGIVFVDTLNAYEVFGFKLGFWFAQQGSIYVFVALIFVYAAKMKKLDAAYGAHTSDSPNHPPSDDG